MTFTVADIIARRLHAAGCRYAFGIPGGEVLVLMDALKRVGIKVILAKHENCAGFMGEGVHHFDKTPAILIATIGPGLANAANVIANAHQDRVPMIILTGCVSAAHQHSYTHQVFDHIALVEPISKAAYRADIDSAAVIADKAVMLATEGRPGPVLIDVPVDIQDADAPGAERLHRAPHASVSPAPGEDLETARKWLRFAERPLVIAGLDVLTQDAAWSVTEFCHAFGAPLITSYKAKGVMPEDDPLALGGAGLSPAADRHLLPLVRKSDCIILAGYDPIEMRTGWQDPWSGDARVIEFSAEPNTHYMHNAPLSFICDIKSGLAALHESVQPHATWSDGEPIEARAALRAGLDLNEHWGPAAIVDECRKSLPRDTVITADSGAHRILISQAWECYEPRGMLQSTALCTMGCAVPLAIGRKLAEPSRPVVGFVGDAGLEMFLGELATARDLKLSIPIVVFVDESLALIELKQRGLEMDNLGVDFPPTDFPVVARALGGHGTWVDNRTELRGAITAALARDSFTVIAARIGRKAYDGRL
jgi:acetolactate synthase-1/2/3 large subunit